MPQDTPDFFRDDDYGKDIDVMDGVMGSSIQNVKKDRNNDPGVAGAVRPSPSSAAVALPPPLLAKPRLLCRHCSNLPPPPLAKPRLACGTSATFLMWHLPNMAPS